MLAGRSALGVATLPEAETPAATGVTDTRLERELVELGTAVVALVSDTLVVAMGEALSRNGSKMNAPTRRLRQRSCPPGHAVDHSRIPANTVVPPE